MCIRDRDRCVGESRFYGTARSLYKGKYEPVDMLKAEEAVEIYESQATKFVEHESFSKTENKPQMGSSMDERQGEVANRERQVEPDPEGIDDPEVSKVEKTEESICDSVDKMYEEIQAFTATHTKPSPINI
eukprot:TRINITY_DN5075_c0_g1_i7.p1 TRINITY_DN5075_c0_g1~~TRINITY_DN5075_c0_g1_i7.p1  ORF type:complete len:131 (+),score=34.99 TRINITY_DN5075_c0_g1_i7:80-472(+)